ncbi:MAG TPA: DUF371 domain-containing protein [Nitrososphaera sp.]|nr:DUF371 domain-containing protein [Nitrososphaera sp.]
MAGTPMAEDEVIFYGHPNVRSLHPKTIEITKDEYLTPRGDCIIGVKGNKACADLDEALKRKLKSNSASVKIELIVGTESFVINGKGDQRLNLSSRHEIVIRRTNFVCPRTLSVQCDKASLELPRKMVNMLHDRGTRAIFRITVE